MTLTERAVVILNHLSLTMTHSEYQKRLDRLVARLTGDRWDTEVGMRRG